MGGFLLHKLVGVLLGNNQASESDETAGDVDAVEVGMQIFTLSCYA